MSWLDDYQQLVQNLRQCSQQAISGPDLLPPLDLFHAMGTEPDPWQLRVTSNLYSRILLLCSRQAGKSYTAAVKAAHTALTRPNSLILLLAKAERQADELYRKVMDCYYAAAKLGPVEPRINDMTSELHLRNGSRIIPLPGKEDTIRSFSAVTLLIIDEASRVPDALYSSVRPMLAVSKGAILALTTPWGKRGFFYDEWIHTERPWERIQVKATDCPRISPEFLAEERASLGERWFNQEYMLSFEDMVGAVFDEADICAVSDNSLAPLW